MVGRKKTPRAQSVVFLAFDLPPPGFFFDRSVDAVSVVARAPIKITQNCFFQFKGPDFKNRCPAHTAAQTGAAELKEQNHKPSSAPSFLFFSFCFRPTTIPDKYAIPRSLSRLTHKKMPASRWDQNKICLSTSDKGLARPPEKIEHIPSARLLEGVLSATHPFIAPAHSPSILGFVNLYPDCLRHFTLFLQRTNQSRLMRPQITTNLVRVFAN